jgi:protein-S-isoprenylcysteine O-methyltransferase Ste14
LKPALRTLRLRGAWLLAAAFVLLARPTPKLVLAGAALALLGLLLRGWAAGTIHKDRELSTGGPYAHTRNPLYLGSLLIGLGAAVAAGRWELLLLFAAFYTAVYGAVIRAEARALEDRFGARYVAWASEVPPLVPRLIPHRGTGADAADAAGFTLERWRRNREHEAALGVLGGFLYLIARLLLGRG